MITRYIQGAWYTDVLQLSEYFAALFSQQNIKFNAGLELSLPGHLDVLYLRYHHNGSNYFVAGQQQDSGNCVISLLGNWTNLGPTHGISPVAFYGNNLFVVRSGNLIEVYDLTNLSKSPSRIEMQVGVNGIRFVTTTKIWTGDETYDGSQTPWNLAEWTLLEGSPNIYIGQGYNGGAIAYFEDDQSRHVVETGDCKWIRAYRDGDNISVAIVKQPENRAKVAWLTVQELRALPLESGEVPVPPPDGDKTMELPKYAHDVVVQLYNKYPELANGNDDQRRELTHRIVQTINARGTTQYGHKQQKGGPPSKDTIGLQSNGLQLWDLFNGGTREPNPHPIHSFLGDPNTQEIITLGPHDWAEEENGGTTPPPDNGTCSNEARVTKLEQDLKQLRKEFEDLRARFDQADATVIHAGDSIALRSQRGKYLRDDWDKNVGMFDRDSAGSGETYRVDRK